jgi:RNA polymerase sigma-70 factor (ECF subfamily)
MVAEPATPKESVLPRYPEIQTALLVSCQAGNPVAIQAFVQHHQRLVFAFLTRLLGADASIEDLAQEVFVRALRALPRFDINGPARVSTWLLTIASRLALDERRRAPQVSMILELGDMSSVTADSPEGIQHRRELGEALTQAVNTLSHDQREAFILAEVHGLTMDELAAVSGVAVGTAKARLSRARERLREVLGPLWEEIQ